MNMIFELVSFKFLILWLFYYIKTIWWNLGKVGKTWNIRNNKCTYIIVCELYVSQTSVAPTWQIICTERPLKHVVDKVHTEQCISDPHTSPTPLLSLSSMKLSSNITDAFVCHTSWG